MSICSKLIVPPTSSCSPNAGGIIQVYLYNSVSSITLDTIPESSSLSTTSSYDPTTGVELFTSTLTLKVINHADDYSDFLSSIRRQPLSAYISFNDGTFEHVTYTSVAQALYLTAYESNSNTKIEEGSTPVFTFTQRSSNPPSKVPQFPTTYTISWVKAIPNFDKARVTFTDGTYQDITPQTTSLTTATPISDVVPTNRTASVTISDPITIDFSSSNYTLHTINFINPPSNLIIKCTKAWDTSSSGLITENTTEAILMSDTTSSDFEFLSSTPPPSAINVTTSRVKFVW